VRIRIQPILRNSLRQEIRILSKRFPRGTATSRRASQVIQSQTKEISGTPPCRHAYAFKTRKVPIVLAVLRAGALMLELNVEALAPRFLVASTLAPLPRF
jgi:hypothetical protein